MGVSRYRKKPVEIEAIQWNGLIETYNNITEFTGKKLEYRILGEETVLFIDTLEGRMRVDEFDWIIKGVQGEFYPCKPDIFQLTYDIVE
jgi:hypothetical protein